jgi:hemerythrin
MNFEWNSSMAIGNEDIDNDHKYLISLIRTIDAAIKCHIQANVLGKFVELLLIYTSVHFVREQQYQKSIGFEESESHKVLHRDFIERLNFMKGVLAQANDDQDKYKSAVTQFSKLMKEWWVEHILVEDSKMQVASCVQK